LISPLGPDDFDHLSRIAAHLPAQIKIIQFHPIALWSSVLTLIGRTGILAQNLGDQCPQIAIRPGGAERC
jgi:hypothetical protein